MADMQLDILDDKKADAKNKPKKISNVKIKSIISNYIYIFIKRGFDIFVGLIGTIILIPLTLFIAIARKIQKEDKGPIFYTHLRIGKNGKQFKLYKYRTMCMNADEKLKKYLEENEEARKEYKKYKKLRNDPRISKLGEILRTTSIDEFPQFFNVLIGNMSLVGPRPYLPREKEDMGKYYESITSCKPGITGYWQVNGRSNTTFEERLELDNYYIKNKSLWLDFKIMIKTALQIIVRKGAL